MKIKFLPILLGSDENAYGCARLFYDEYKIKPLLICSRALPPTSYSKILVRRVVKDFDTPYVFKGVMGELLDELKKKAERLIVIPCSDYYTDLTVKNRELFINNTFSPILSEELYKKVCDKKAFYSLCREKGLPFPETEIMSAEQLLSATLPFDFPIVIKPENSNSYSYLHLNIENRKKVYFCQNREELKTVAESFFAVGYADSLIVQRYIDGNRSLTVNAYCGKDGRVRLIGAAEPLLEYNAPSLIGNYAALKTVKSRELCNEIIDFLEDIGYVGLVNFDLKFDEKSGRYLFFELNPRQGRSSYYIRTAGESLIKTLCDDVIFDVKYSGVKYAESEGVWRNIPSLLLKRKAPSLPKNLRTDTAISYLYDFSPMRALTLLRRDIGSARLIKDTDGNEGWVIMNDK